MLLSRSRPETVPKWKPARAGLWLTGPIALLAAVATVAELFFDVFRGDEINLIAQAIGQDVVTLAVAVPALVVGAILAGRGSDRARLIWMGVLAYLLYTYAIYALQVRFNVLFLVYVALLGLSLYALIWGLVTTDLTALRSRFSKRTPVRTVSVFLATMAALFYLVWLGEVVPALLAGTVPPSVAQAGTPTGAAHVLDMAWMLPAMAMAAVLLWRGREIGYALAGVLLAFMPLMTLAIGAMMVAMPFYGQPVAIGMAVVFGAIAVVGAGMLAWYLGSIGSGDIRPPDGR